MAAPAFETAATSGSASLVNPATVSLPSGIAAGDVLIFSISNGSGRTYTTPSGWTLVEASVDSASVSRTSTFRRVADGAEGATVSVTLSNVANFNAVAVRVSGADGTTPVDVSAADATASNSVSPSVTTTGADRLIVRIMSMGRDRTFTEPSGYTEHAEATTGGNCDLAIATAAQASAGASGTATWTVGGGSNDRSIHHVLAIAPAAGGGSSLPVFQHYYRQRRRA